MVRRAQRPGEVVEQPGHLSRPAEIEAALQRGHGAGEVALIELEGAEAEEGEEKRETCPASSAICIASRRRPNASANRPSAPSALASVSRTHEPWMVVITEPLLRQALRDQRERGLAVPDGLAALAPRHVHLAEMPVGDNLDGDVRLRLADGQGAKSGLDRRRKVAGQRERVAL